MKLRFCGIRVRNVPPYPPWMVIAKLERTDRYGTSGCHGIGALRGELADVLAGETPSLEVRGEIIDSWRKSAAFGLSPDQFDLPFAGRDEPDPHLISAAAPVVDRLASDLASTEISVVLAGERGRIVDRRSAGQLEEAQLDELMLSTGYLWGIEHAGTNGLSMALEEGMPMLVQGDEHFAEVLTTMATAGAPIRDPHTGHVVGALAFVCSAEAANQLLLPMVRRAVREVEQRLLSVSSGLDRLVQAQFLDARRRTRDPLAAISRDSFLTNAAAARIVPTADRSRLWDFVLGNLSVPDASKTHFTLTDGRAVSVSLEAILDGGEVAGALVRFAASTRAPLSRHSHSSKRARPTFGWDSLTEAEHSVSELVAESLTNREVASRLFVSPHTVDTHLRHIFRKLDINSRVDLVRMVTARSFTQRSLIGAADVA
jgi:DNA-binding CsgD family transcriptional regulator